MIKRSKATFDPEQFLAKVDEGKTVSKYRTDQIIFSQGEAADAVFLSSEEMSSSLLFPNKARRAVVAILAEMIGTTRARVSFFMNKFRKLGFIDYNGKLEVHTSLLNMVLHDKSEIKTGN